MDKVLELFKNPWVVGIITGIISGIVVFFVTKFIVKKAGKAEYFQQVKNANNSIINALKPYIADRGLPERMVFEAIINSTARKFGVLTKDLYSVEIFCEELIQEIITDIYVSSEKKAEYTKELSEYINKSHQEDTPVLISANMYRKYSNKMIESLSLSISISIGLFCAIFVLLMSFESLPIIGIRLSGHAKSLLVIVITLLATFCVLFTELAILSKKRQLKKKEDQECKVKEDDQQK